MRNRIKEIFFLLFLILLMLPSISASAAPCTQPEHNYQPEIIEYADEEHDGLRQYTCIYCQDTYQETIPRTGHHFGEFKMEQAADCIHEGVKVRECTECGEKEYEIIPYTNRHDYGEWYTEESPTCSVLGISQRTCRVCGGVEQKIIPAEGSHAYQKTQIPAGCTEDGQIIYRCINCGDTYSEQIPATGHKWGELSIIQEPTSDKEGRGIRVCEFDESHVQEVSIPKLAEPETETETEPVTEESEVIPPETEAIKPVKPAEAKRPLVNELDLVLGAINVTTVGGFIFFIKMDWYVISWHLRKRKSVKRVRRRKRS